MKLFKALIALGIFSVAFCSVVQLTDENFDELVTKSDNFWIVHFNSVGNDKNEAVLENAANWLRGVVKFGSIEKGNSKLNEKFGIKSQKLALFGDDKNEPVTFKGRISAEEIAEFANEQIVKAIEQRVGKQMKKSSPKFNGKRKTNSNKNKKSNEKKKNKKNEKKGDGSVVVLTDQNFDKLVLNSNDAWMVEFFAPWCGHCKHLEPEWKEAAKQLGGAVKFGALDATVNTAMAEKFGIRGYPTIKYFGPGSSQSDAEDYQGGRSASELASFAWKKAEQIAPPPEAVQGISREVVEEACHEKQLCIFAFLPHILDCQSKCRKDQIKLFNEIVASFKRSPWGWIWIEGGSQQGVEAALGVGGFGYPAVSVLSPKKMMFSTLKGSFTKESMTEFLNGISYGKSRVESIKASLLAEDGFLKVVDIEEWDGKDGEVPMMLDDEFDKTEL